MAADSALLLGLVEEFVLGQQDRKAVDTAGQFTILQLVEALGLHLTSSQPQTRGRGVQLLSNVLQECYGDLTEREVEVLIVFYENRLKDHYVITPHVIQGLKALTKCSVLPPGSAVSILKSLFQDIHVQVVTLIDYFSHPTELKGLGADFVFGFVQSVDGERDPRNLLLAFHIARKIVHEGYDLGKFTEELFEVTSCYFPIDFSPPANDPHGITQEELVLALRVVLTGTPRFAEFLLPLIIEKLDSDVQSAKLDSLQTLTACASVYEQKDLAQFLPGLWASLRREVFQTASERVESAGLAAVGTLTACLSRSVLNSDSEDSLNVFLELVLKDCQHHLCEPDLKLVWPSAKLLQATSTASYRASHRVAAAVLPSLIEQYNSRTQVSHTIQLGRSIIVNVGVRLTFLTSLCSIVFSALSESNADLQITSMRVLTALGQQTGLLLESDVELAVDHLTRLILEEGDPKVSLAVVECAGSLARLHPAAFISKMPFPLLFPEPMAQGDSATPSQEHSQQAVRQRCVAALAAVSSRPSLVQESTPVLLQVLTSAHTGTGAFSLEEVISVCHSLQKIAEQAQDTEETGGVFHDVIPRLLGLALQAALQGENIPTNSLLAGQTASRAVSLFLDGDVSFLPENAFPAQIQLLKVEVPQMDRLLLELLELSCTCDHPLSYTSAAKCYAGLVNKSPAGEALDSLIDRTLKRISTELDSASSPVRTQAFTLLLWVSKALLLRYHPLSTALTDKLFSLLSDPELGWLAADGFSLLMSDSPDVLNRGSHADVRMMYRQRFFTENSAKLVEGFNAAVQEKKSGYLKALSHIVNNLPRQVQLTELPALLPLLLEALLCPDQGVQVSTLSCLQPVLLDPPSALITQLEVLVGRTLALTTSPTMKVRIASLRCIHALSRFPEHEIMPFRARVLRALAAPLDDHKRVVRSEAAVARNEW
uniref:MMS19 nucleotide excision repair protein n=1 Tax=Oncorhynchus tshawytscha TaxID=74940 RepID=A0A8C8G090_ONCTS